MVDYTQTDADEVTDGWEAFKSEHEDMCDWDLLEDVSEELRDMLLSGEVSPDEAFDYLTQ